MPAPGIQAINRHISNQLLLTGGESGLGDRGGLASRGRELGGRFRTVGTSEEDRGSLECEYVLSLLGLILGVVKRRVYL